MTLPALRNYELHKITTYDGEEFVINDDVNKLILSPTPADWGMPRIDYNTRRAYMEYGESVVGFNFSSRNLRLEFLEKLCDRTELFEARKELLNFLHPRRGGDLTYTFIREDQTMRAIKGRATGPGFGASNNDNWEEWDIDDPLTIECFNPIWFNPETVTADVGDQISDDELVLEAYFPIMFGSGTVTYSFTISYAGTWFTFPTIAITGPSLGFVLTHVDLDKTITYRRRIAAGETLTLDLINQTLISSADGLDYWGYIASTSDLAGFVIEYDPIVLDGINSFDFQLDGATAASAVVVTYLERFLGI